MCGPASGWSKVALVVLIVGISIHIAGWATTNWMTYSTTNNALETNIGLWRMIACTSGSCKDTSVASQYETATFNAVRAMETITFCLAFFTMVLLFIYMCAEGMRTPTGAAVIMVLCYVAGACSFVGMVVFITSVPDPFVVSFSLGLTVIGMTLILIAGTLMIPDSFDNNDESIDDDDDYYGHRRRSAVSPMPLFKRGPTSRGVTPISYKGAIEGSRWRSY
ncbi:uncharacterized protein LOC106065833 [Biomphalaria glabrata]|uniref:Uncharacterized protein LOC106065833 n=1 Tax=Biomphalaria glabrata TaxID=6526 RepID=A0A9W3BAY8_BIOGL|nr:uncharacterized protein LOC106065833 [Biomphalaria glabrata]XP_055896594.1 uncharacterized protein LOC106065833 [Biomphalaria glabrata]XP_055896602.1 uncharacterized protein LOC106065833 [Biomphalaria glabrata]XP_055896611.1 uncharacterized protein LOC106065833 [Biomphalaria glabrata]